MKQKAVGFIFALLNKVIAAKVCDATKASQSIFSLVQKNVFILPDN